MATKIIPASGGYSGIPYTPARTVTVPDAPKTTQKTASQNVASPESLGLSDRANAERQAAAAAAAAAAANKAPVYNAPAPVNIPGTVTSTGNISTTGTPASPTAEETAAAITGATTLTDAEMARENAILVMQERFKRYGLETLTDRIRKLAIEGATESTITLQLQESPEYQARFKANSVRAANNLQVLSPAEYLTAEDTYRQVLRSYGLVQFDTDEYVSQFLANDVSPTELNNRVTIAVNRVQNADPAVQKQLRDYYGINDADLIAYALDPDNQTQKIERQVQAAEIGAAARAQGLQAQQGYAEQLAAQGVTQAEAQKGYATIADILPTAEKLSDIYGATMDSYGQEQAQQEVFGQLASAQRARQKLTAREVAQFGGSSGMAKSSPSKSSGLI